MYNRLISFMDSSKLLCDNQFGFRQKHSTYMALLNIIDQISASIDDGKYITGIFLDLSMAFDTINHYILLQILEVYGIRSIELAWLASYFSNRTQCVSIYDFMSESKLISCGVPQGSILGLQLFLFYINDIVRSSDLLKYVMFADDTNLFMSNIVFKTLLSNVNDELSLEMLKSK